MSQALIKGYGEVSIVDDAGHRQSIGTANDITDVGLERILSADTALRGKSAVFPYIILSHELPIDKDVYTRAELDAAGVLILDNAIIDQDQALTAKHAIIGFQSNISRIPGKEFTYDVISLAYTDGDNWYISSRAKAIDPETLLLRDFTLPGNTQIYVSYTLTLALYSTEGVATIQVSPKTEPTTLSGEFTTEWNTTNKRYSRSTRLPYVPGSRKIQWQFEVNTSSATTNCRMMGSLFSIWAEILNNRASSSGILEIEFIRAQDAVESLGIELVAPTTILETIGLVPDYNGDIYRLSIRAAPFTEVYILYDNRLLATIFTDAAGLGTCNMTGYFYDPILEESRQITDGIMFRAILVNPLGRSEHDYIPMDTSPNRLYHYYWEDNTTLQLINRLNDKIEVFLDYGYVKSGQPIVKKKLGETILTTSNPLYGVDGATGSITLDIPNDNNVFFTSTIRIRLTDAAGNVSENYDIVTPELGNLNIPNVNQVRNTYNRYGTNVTVGDPIYIIPLITKGSIS